MPNSPLFCLGNVWSIDSYSYEKRKKKQNHFFQHPGFPSGRTGFHGRPFFQLLLPIYHGFRERYQPHLAAQTAAARVSEPNRTRQGASWPGLLKRFSKDLTSGAQLRLSRLWDSKPAHASRSKACPICRK